MITLEQIRLLEGKITRAIDLIRVLKEENGTLRKGLESAQKRMKELETLVDGFKTDQKEIESVIVRTLHNLDELEENAVATRKAEHAVDSALPADAAPVSAPPHSSNSASSARASGEKMEAPEGRAAKEELDIF
jgi:chromosome segregation ATPase